MTVKELIAELQKMPPDMPAAIVFDSRVCVSEVTWVGVRDFVVGIFGESPDLRAYYDAEGL